MARTSRLAGLFAFAVAVALMAACSGERAPDPSPTPEPRVTLNVFQSNNHFDMSQEPLDEYRALHPNVSFGLIGEPTYSSTLGVRDAVGALAEYPQLDVIPFGAEELGGVMEVSDQFVDLREYGADELRGDYLPWRWAQAVDADGRVIGYPIDIGPLGMCFRQDLLAEAGIARDRDELAEVLDADGGGWDVYFNVGRRYHEATGRAWFDHSGWIWDAMVNQLDEGVRTPDGQPNIEGNAELRARWDLLAAAVADGLSAGETAWDWQGGRRFVEDTFATVVCPNWMLDNIQSMAEDFGGGPETGWDFVGFLPDGTVNWGGMFVGVPESSERKEAAVAFITWLAEPEQQLKEWERWGGFPTSLEAIDQLVATADPRPFFNDAPVAVLLAELAEEVHVNGADDYQTQSYVFGPAVAALDGGASGEVAWNQALGLLDELEALREEWEAG